MWRVRSPEGQLSDVANLICAKDAAARPCDLLSVGSVRCRRGDYAHPGFRRGTLAGLVRAGLAMAQHKIINADRRLLGSIRITAAGRRVIEE
jgi:hypothetical protein